MFADIWFNNLKNKPEKHSVKNLKISINNNKDNNDKENEMTIILLKKIRKLLRSF